MGSVRTFSWASSGRAWERILKSGQEYPDLDGKERGKDSKVAELAKMVKTTTILLLLALVAFAASQVKYRRSDEILCDSE